MRFGDSQNAVITRLWRGWTSPRNADAYERLLRATIFPGIAQRQVPGYGGIALFRRAVGDEVEFVTVMAFASMEAVRAFAGDDVDAAIVPESAKALLSRFDARSAHYDTPVPWRPETGGLV